MKNMSIKFRSCIVYMMFGLFLGTTGCGESTSTPDRPVVTESDSSVSSTSSSENLPPPASSSVEERTVRGALVKVEGDRYMVKNLEGTDQVFTTTSDTLIDEGMTEGDQIIVKLGEEGNAIAIRKDRSTDS